MTAPVPRSAVRAPGRVPGTTQTVMTARMRKRVEAARLAPCKRQHDWLMSVDFGHLPPTVVLISCGRCGERMAPDGVSDEELRRERLRSLRRQWLRCQLLPSPPPEGEQWIRPGLWAAPVRIDAAYELRRAPTFESAIDRSIEAFREARRQNPSPFATDPTGAPTE